MTVPKVIASGETITIPAGRVAILPNVQIGGVLNVEGEVFIPSGATLGDLDAQLALKAPLVNPAFTNPTATTQTAQDNSTKVATTAYVDGKMVLGTAVNSTSGTSIDFTGIPSWVKRITIMFNGVSTNGASIIQVQLGDSEGVETTGYNTSTGIQAGGITSVNTYTSAFSVVLNITAATFFQGNIVFTNINLNEWIGRGSTSSRNGDTINNAVGSKTLSNKLDKVRITTANGTDTFDAGQINILYEG